MVYRGIDGMGNVAAIKTHHPDRIRLGMARLLAREAEILLGLELSGVTRVVGRSGLSDPTQPYIAFELVDGPNLHDVLQRRGPLPASMQCSIAEQLAVTLCGVHSAPAVHEIPLASPP